MIFSSGWPAIKGVSDGQVLAISKVYSRRSARLGMREVNEEFYRAPREYPVPVNEADLRAIEPRSMMVNVYLWLAYGLHALSRDVSISWPASHAKFGDAFQLIRKFRAHFIGRLVLAKAAYPNARVSVGKRGLVLKPSRSAIPKPSAWSLVSGLGLGRPGLLTCRGRLHQP